MQRKSMMLGGLAAIASALVLTTAPASAQMGRYGTTQQTGPTTQQMMQGQHMQSMSGEPLSTLADPSSTLASATVQDSTGQPIGQVKSVQTSSAGTANSVAVSLKSGDNSGKIVTIKADKLMFDPNSKVVKSSLTIQEIDQLPTTQSP